MVGHCISPCLGLVSVRDIYYTCRLSARLWILGALKPKDALILRVRGVEHCAPKTALEDSVRSARYFYNALDGAVLRRTRGVLKGEQYQSVVDRYFFRLR